MVKSLTDILWRSDDSKLRIASASLLFDIHNRENLLFCDALSSYLYTGLTRLKVEELFDMKKLLVKMHRGKLSKNERGDVLMCLSKIASYCLLKGDPAEPHRCFQGITHSTGK